MTVEDAHKLKTAGKEGRFYKQDKEASGVVIEGMRPTFYNILDSFDDPIGYANRRQWFGGERLDFGFFELPEAYEESQDKSDTDQFMYVIQGTIDANVNGEKQSVKRGDVIQINIGESYSLSSDGSDPVRLARVRPTPAAIKLIDSLPPQKT
ncbi:MAG: cupin domain-containing protein [Rhodospirillales bacterium]